MKINFFICLTALCVTVVHAQKAPFAANPVSASQSMIDYQSMELIGFVHFNMNTFTDKEWGYGDESEKIFNPTNLDVEQLSLIHI